MVTATTPPHNLSAERTILSAMMYDKQCALASQQFTTNDFYDTKHHYILQAIQQLVSEGTAVDMLTVVDQLRDSDKLDKVSGASYISNLASSYISAANFTHHKNIVKEHSLKRQAIEKSYKLLNEAYEGSVDNVKKHLHEFSLIGYDEADRTYEGMETLVMATHEDMEKRYKNKGKGIGIKTGLTGLDKMILGMEGGEYIMIAARPSMGKTALALNIADNVAQKEDGPCVFFSLEMQKNQVMHRLFASNALVNLGKIRSGAMSDKDWMKASRAMPELSRSNLIIDDTDALTTVDIEYRLSQIIAEQGKPSLVVIDYLQYVRPLNERASETEATTANSRELKSLAKRFDVPFVILSQLSRAPEQRADHRPMLSDLRQSGAIEQDADIVMFLYRDDYYNQDSDKKGIAEIIIGKQRNGIVGTIEMAWLGAYQRFEALEKYRG